MQLDSTNPLRDPRADGCDCDNCPLKNRVPVFALPISHPRLAIVAEAPGHNEVVEGVPLVGASGYLLRRNLKRLKVDEATVFKTNAVLCRPPEKMSGADWKQALVCCRPRLERELSATGNAQILAIGGKALATLTDNPDKIQLWRGAPLKGRAPFESRTILPTIHPAFILRGHDEFDPVFRIDLQRALYPDMCAWTWPETHIEAGPGMEDALRAILASQQPTGIDVETAGIDPLTSGLLCIGLATKDVAISVPWPPQNVQIEQLTLQILQDAQIPKVFHNAQYDLLTLRAQNIDVCGVISDTLLMHAVVANQLPHNLGFVASNEFPGPRWKSEFRDEDAEATKSGVDFGRRDPLELRLYNAKDAYMTALLYYALRKRVEKTYRGWSIYTQQHLLGDLATRMRGVGVLVDKSTFDDHRKELTTAMAKEVIKFNQLCPLSHVLRGKELKSRTHVYIGPYRLGANGLHEDVRRLFFKRLGVKVTKRTEKGQASIDDEVMQYIMASYPEPLSELARIVLNYRQYQKLLSTYIDGLPVSIDGCVHPVWKCFGTRTDRFASQDPNWQNQPSKMRNIFVPRPGKYFVAADYSQLEGRIVALLSGDEKLLEWYNTGKNVYLETARAIWGPQIGKASLEYKAAKSTILGINYGGGPDTLWRNMLKKGLKVSFDTVRRVHEFYFKQHPALQAWQMEQVRLAGQLKYAEGPLSGRRIYFHLGRIEPNKAINFPVQNTAAEMKNRALLALDKLLDWNTEAIVGDVHDEIVLEGPEPLRLGRLLKQTMEQTITLNGRTMRFGVEVKASSKNFRDMEPLTC